MDHQSVVCDKCTGVLLATDSRTYTTQRSRLILSNGYCTCPSAQAPAAQAPAERASDQQPQPATEQAAAQPQAVHTPQAAPTPQQNAQPAGQNSMVVA